MAQDNNVEKRRDMVEEKSSQVQLVNSKIPDMLSWLHVSASWSGEPLPGQRGLLIGELQHCVLNNTASSHHRTCMFARIENALPFSSSISGLLFSPQ